MAYRVAVVGATGAVGREMLKTLAERSFPVSEVVALASGRSTGSEVSFGDKQVLKVKNLETFDFRGWDIGLFSPGASVSAVHAPRAAEAGCVVIDNTSQFRMDHDIPLVVPEVNPHHLAKFARRNIIANPNCSTIQMVVALKPLHDRFKIRRVVVSTYQSVSGAGKEAMDELYAHTKSVFVHEQSPPQQFTKEIAFNCIPQIDKFMEDGSTKEEWKMAVETRKILDPDIAGACHLRARPGVHRPWRGGERGVLQSGYRSARRGPRCAISTASRWSISARTAATSPRPSALGEDAVFVSRIRKDPTIANGLSFWCVSDNLRKGAALNAVQIAETLVAQGLLAKQAA